MPGAIVWPLAVVIIWAALFIMTLSLVRWIARGHDHDAALDMDRTQHQPPHEGAAPTQEEVAPPETAGQPATA